MAALHATPDPSGAGLTSLSWHIEGRFAPLQMAQWTLLRQVAHIRRRATEVFAAEERGRFIELVETDLMNLHDGNLARARLSPTEYSAWKAGWC